MDDLRCNECNNIKIKCGKMLQNCSKEMGTKDVSNLFVLLIYIYTFILFLLYVCSAMFMSGYRRGLTNMG